MQATQTFPQRMIVINENDGNMAAKEGRSNDQLAPYEPPSFHPYPPNIGDWNHTSSSGHQQMAFNNNESDAGEVSDDGLNNVHRSGGPSRLGDENFNDNFNIEASFAHGSQVPAPYPSILSQQVRERVLEIFPHLCHEYFERTYEDFLQGKMWNALTADVIAENLILQIADLDSYPTTKVKPIVKKRKRAEEAEGDGREEKRWSSKARRSANRHEVQEAYAVPSCKSVCASRLIKPSRLEQRPTIRYALLTEFPIVPLKFIDQKLKEHKNLFPAYEAIHAAVQSYDTEMRVFEKLKKSRKRQVNALKFVLPEMAVELEAARAKRKKENVQKAEAKLEAEREAALEKKAQEEGDTIECKCCFSDVRTAKTTHCNGDPCHFFCHECMTGTTKAQIELGRYKIVCMDASGCEADFTMEEKQKFLNESTRELLDRLQQQTEIREAEIEGLETCTQCDYAEICPPKDQDRIFTCRNENCEVISICRLCRLDAHVPKNCEENKKELGLSERNTIAEAMTEALIRRCPKCEVPIIKAFGCNKIICSKCGCAFCDVCNADITKAGYQHFEGRSACQTSDHDLARVTQRVKEAESIAKNKLMAENPNLTEENLEIKFAEAVKSHGRSATIEADNGGRRADAVRVRRNNARVELARLQLARRAAQHAILAQTAQQNDYQTSAAMAPFVLGPQVYHQPHQRIAEPLLQGNVPGIPPPATFNFTNAEAPTLLGQYAQMEHNSPPAANIYNRGIPLGGDNPPGSRGLLPFGFAAHSAPAPVAGPVRYGAPVALPPSMFNWEVEQQNLQQQALAARRAGQQKLPELRPGAQDETLPLPAHWQTTQQLDYTGRVARPTVHLEFRRTTLPPLSPPTPEHLPQELFFRGLGVPMPDALPAGNMALQGTANDMEEQDFQNSGPQFMPWGQQL